MHLFGEFTFILGDTPISEITERSNTYGDDCNEDTREFKWTRCGRFCDACKERRG